MNSVLKRVYRVASGLFMLSVLVACSESIEQAGSGESQIPLPTDAQVVFVCLHGNVKSLMASAYFNELAEQRGLPYRAMSRGTEPDSSTVPPAIIEGLSGDGFDVSAFSPSAVSLDDVSDASRVVLINTELSDDLQVSGVTSEQWSDVPPASVDYAKARESLKSHVEQLITELESKE